MDVIGRVRLRLIDHILRKDENIWARSVTDINVTGSLSRGKPRTMWINVVE